MNFAVSAALHIIRWTLSWLLLQVVISYLRCWPGVDRIKLGMLVFRRTLGPQRAGRLSRHHLGQLAKVFLAKEHDQHICFVQACFFRELADQLFELDEFCYLVVLESFGALLTLRLLVFGRWWIHHHRSVLDWLVISEYVFEHLLHSWLSRSNLGERQVDVDVVEFSDDWLKLWVFNAVGGLDNP